MKQQYFTFTDCIARFEGDEVYPTEWELFPIHHADPFWNADLFDERQSKYQEFSSVGQVFEVYGDWVSRDVKLQVYTNRRGMMLEIRDRKLTRSIWLEKSARQSFRDYIINATE